MKLLGLLLLSSCAYIGASSHRVGTGVPESEVKAYGVQQERKFSKHNIFTLKDSIVVSDKKTVIEKWPLQHPYEFATNVTASSRVEGQKFRYLVKVDPRLVDPKSIYFVEVKKQIEFLLKLNNEEVVSELDHAEAILLVGYAVTGYQKTTTTMNGIPHRQDTSYTRIFTLTAASTNKDEVNLWETRVDSMGTNNDLKIAVPGLLTAAGLFINKNGADEVSVPDTSVTLNMIKSPDKFRQYVD